MRKTVKDSIKSKLYLIEEESSIINTKNYFIFLINNVEKPSLYFEDFEYHSSKVGSIDEIDVKGEVVAFNEKCNYNDIILIFNSLKYSMEDFTNLYDWLLKLEKLIKTLKLPNENEIQGIFSELLLVYKYPEFGKYFRGFIYDKHDFLDSINNLKFEVKSTIKRNNNIFKIKKNQLAKGVIFITIKLNKEGFDTINLFNLYDKVNFLFDQDSFIHSYILSLKKLKLVYELKFSVDESEISFYNMDKYINSIVINNDRVIDYDVYFDFTDIEKIQCPY